MLQGTPDVAAIDESAAAFGLRIEHEPVEVCEIWAEHWPALRLFGAMQTQWHTGLNGRAGLNYAVLPLVEQRLGITPRKARRAFEHLQVMEAEALRIWREQAGA